MGWFYFQAITDPSLNGLCPTLPTCSPPNTLLWTCAFSSLSSFVQRKDGFIKLSDRNRFIRLLLYTTLLSMNVVNGFPFLKNAGEKCKWIEKNPNTLDGREALTWGFSFNFLRWSEARQREKGGKKQHSLGRRCRRFMIVNNMLGWSCPSHTSLQEITLCLKPAASEMKPFVSSSPHRWSRPTKVCTTCFAQLWSEHTSYTVSHVLNHYIFKWLNCA